MSKNTILIAVVVFIVAEMNHKGNLVLTVVYEYSEKEDTLMRAGKRMAPLPPKPDLSKVTFGEPVNLLANGLEDWQLTNPKKINDWRFENGVLINETPKKDFGAYGSYGNLRTNADYTDFELSVDYNVPEGGNSGIYLRGTYEVQVVGQGQSDAGYTRPRSHFWMY